VETLLCGCLFAHCTTRSGALWLLESVHDRMRRYPSSRALIRPPQARGPLRGDAGELEAGSDRHPTKQPRVGHYWAAGPTSVSGFKLRPPNKPYVPKFDQSSVLGPKACSIHMPSGPRTKPSRTSSGIQHWRFWPGPLRSLAALQQRGRRPAPCHFSEQCRSPGLSRTRRPSLIGYRPPSAVVVSSRAGRPNANSAWSRPGLLEARGAN